MAPYVVASSCDVSSNAGLILLRMMPLHVLAPWRPPYLRLSFGSASHLVSYIDRQAGRQAGRYNVCTVLRRGVSRFDALNRRLLKYGSSISSVG